MCQQLLGFHIRATLTQKIIGSSSSSGQDAPAMASFAPPNIEIGRGIVGCAVASDRG
jgi:hypothetical protein